MHSLDLFEMFNPYTDSYLVEGSIPEFRLQLDFAKPTNNFNQMETLRNFIASLQIMKRL